MFKQYFFATLFSICFITPAIAWDPLETVEESRERHSAENYEYHSSYGTPLGGYSETLGDPAPSGTEQPGFITHSDNDNSDSGYGFGSTHKSGYGYDAGY